MTQEEIKELIRQEIKDNLKITIDSERVMFSDYIRVEVKIQYNGDTISDDYFRIEIKND